MAIDIGAIRKFEEAWKPIIDAIPAVVTMAQQQTALERDIALKRTELAEAQHEIKVAYEEADKRLAALNDEMARIMACNKDYEEQTAQLVAARDREISELISNRKKATTAAEKKLADVEAKLAAVEADIAKKQADFDAGVKAKTDAAEQALADIEKRRQAAESALEALRAKLG